MVTHLHEARSMKTEIAELKDEVAALRSRLSWLQSRVIDDIASKIFIDLVTKQNDATWAAEKAISDARIFCQVSSDKGHQSLTEEFGFSVSELIQTVEHMQGVIMDDHGGCDSDCSIKNHMKEIGDVDVKLKKVLDKLYGQDK